MTGDGRVLAAVGQYALEVTSIVHGTCHHDCPDSCGWSVTVDDGVLVKMRGRADHPYSAGELCPAELARKWLPHTAFCHAWLLSNARISLETSS